MPRVPEPPEIEAADAIYAEINGLHAGIAHQPGFVILHAPLMIDPPLLIIGERPNRAAENQQQHQRPFDDMFSLRHGVYQMALMTTGLFERADRLHVLAQTQFFDMNFFRKITGEPAVFAQQGSDICAEYVGRLIELINPKKIVTTGWRALEQLAAVADFDLPDRRPAMLDLINDHSFWMQTDRGNIKVVPLMHLSGRGSKDRTYRAAISRLQHEFA